MSATPPLQGADRLAFLYRIAGVFNSTLDLDRVLDTVMDEVLLAVRAERGFVVLREADGRLLFRAARGLDQHTLDGPAFQISRGVVEKVLQEGAPQWTSDAQNEDWLRLRQSVVVLGLRSILCVPLQVQGRTLGVIYVDNRLQAGLFTAADLEMLAAIAPSAAVAIENARLYQVAVEKGRLERELQVAREVQLSFLPRRLPQIPGWQFAAFWQPAREVAGDFYDLFPLHPAPQGLLGASGAPAVERAAGAPGSPGQGAAAADGASPATPPALGLVIADVSDKGMPAALFMVLSRSIVRASMAGGWAPAEGIARANRLICADATSGMFVSLFYAQLRPATGDLTYVNAGHNPPLLLRAAPAGPASAEQAPRRAQGPPVELTRTGMVLGIEEAASYDERRLALGPGDLLLLYTDGLTEALDAQGQEFGLERVQALLLKHARASAAELAAALENALAAWVQGSTPPASPLPISPHDDVTVVVIKRL